MKPIDRETAQKALESLLRIRRLKPIWLVMVFLLLTIAVMLGLFLHWYVGLPLNPESGGRMVFNISSATVGFYFIIIQTVTLFCLILAKNNKDILLIYLAQRQLQADAEDNQADAPAKEANHASD